MASKASQLTTLLSTVSILLLAGCGASANPRSGETVPISFTQKAPRSLNTTVGSPSTTVADLGGLLIKAQCATASTPRPILEESAESRIDGARLSYSFLEKSGAATPYLFDLDAGQFDRGDATNLFGTEAPVRDGTLVFSRPDGGEVSVTFSTGVDEPERRCLFNGVATYAPASE